jgi:hypothetical protein
LTQKTRWQSNVIAGLYATDNAAKGIGGRARNRIGKYGFGMSAAVAGMGTNIEPGPIDGGLDLRGCDRHIDVGRPCGIINRENAQAKGRKHAAPGSVAAFHWVGIPNVSIRAANVTITQFCRRTAIKDMK